ncbi:MAG: recombinase family protein, partial [Sedimentibacter sp.]
LKDRIDTFRKLFENNEILKEFDREIFESVIEKIIVGKIDEDGNKNPYSVTFIFKTGLEIEKNDKKSNLYSYPTYDTRGVRSIDNKSKRLRELKTLIYQGF